MPYKRPNNPKAIPGEYVFFYSERNISIPTNRAHKIIEIYQSYSNGEWEYEINFNGVNYFIQESELLYNFTTKTHYNGFMFRDELKKYDIE